MPRVLLTGFCAVPGPRRAGVQLRHAIKALTPLHTVDLLVVREGEQGYVERQGSVRVLRVPTHEAGLHAQIQAFQRALRRQLDGADYDIVHCRDSWSGLPVLDARARLGYAVVYDLARSPLGETTGDAELDAQYARDEEACLLAADLVLAPTPAAVKALQHRGRPERVVLSPPGVDIDRFDWDDPPTGDLPRILYVGTLDPGRGVRVLIRAMASIVREVDARLVLAGGGAPRFRAALEQQIRELGLGDRVELLGPVDHDQLPALFATATVCVVPAAADLTPNPTVVFPTKILEYMACRRAIVAPRRDTVAQVVENNREALLFEPGDPVDLARKVLRLLGEPLLRDRVAQHAYERVRRDFTASAARRALRHAYNVVIDRFEIEPEPVPEEEGPKIELLADDDFEATVFEEAPVAPQVDTAVNALAKLEPLDEALASLEAGGNTSAESPVAPPAPDETMERAVLAVPASDAGDHWTGSVLAAPPAPSGGDDWVVTNVAAAVRAIDEVTAIPAPTVEEGTASHGVVVPAAPPPVTAEGSFVVGEFVAGEIDVPTPPPLRADDPAASEFTAAGPMLGPSEPDPDTGSRTPPLERR